MKTYWESGDTAPYILDLDITWMWVVSLTLRALYTWGKSLRHPLDRGWVGPRADLDAAAKWNSPIIAPLGNEPRPSSP